MIHLLLRARDAYRRLRGWHSLRDVAGFWDDLSELGLPYSAISVCVDAATQGARVHSPRWVEPDRELDPREPFGDAPSVILFDVPPKLAARMAAARYEQTAFNERMWSYRGPHTARR